MHNQIMWTALVMPGDTVTEVHVIPLADARPHTVPICWCKPQRSTTQRLWTHNAIRVKD